MTALDAALAEATVAQVHVELTLDRLPGNLDLILLLDAGLVDGAAAVGTNVGERRLVRFVNSRGWWPVAFGAVSVARLAARLLGLVPLFTLGEGGGLAFASPALLVEELTQTLVFRRQFGVLPPERLTSLAEPFLHADNIGNDCPRSCAPGKKLKDEGEEGALTNYGSAGTTHARAPLRTLRVAV